jgi:hypothetical protein
VTKPGDAHPIAGRETARSRADGIDHSDDLVARDHVASVHRQVALYHVEVGATDPAHRDLHTDLTLIRRGLLYLSETKGSVLHRPRFGHLPGEHVRNLLNPVGTTFCSPDQGLQDCDFFP